MGPCCTTSPWARATPTSSAAAVPWRRAAGHAGAGRRQHLQRSDVHHRRRRAVAEPNGLGDYTQATNTIAISGGTLESTGNTYDLGSNRALTLGDQRPCRPTRADDRERPVTNGANPLTVTGEGNTTISGAIGNGSGGLTMSGAGVLTLSANNSYTGGTTVTNGTVTVTKNNALGTGTVNLAAGANLNISSVASISGLAGNYYNFAPSTNDLSSLATFNATLAGKTPALTSNSATAGAASTSAKPAPVSRTPTIAARLFSRPSGTGSSTPRRPEAIPSTPPATTAARSGSTATRW